jgi:hypothetical protein
VVNRKTDGRGVVSVITNDVLGGALSSQLSRFPAENVTFGYDFNARRKRRSWGG